MQLLVVYLLARGEGHEWLSLTASEGQISGLEPDVSLTQELPVAFWSY